VTSPEPPPGLNRGELARYAGRVGERWPLERALLGGARVADLRGAPSQRERGPEYVVVLVSGAFDGMPWLERVYHAGNLWDAGAMGARADVHCYTPVELERKVASLRKVRETVGDGVDLLVDVTG
jgi:L-alanine-DL-glutamate epimerase-like enolase superfamily enzyme